MKANIRRKLQSFENEMTLWNFESALKLAREFKDFPTNAYHLIRSLMGKHGNCGSQRIGYSYIGVPKCVNTIMEIASPWLSSKREGGKKRPKAIAVN